MAPRLLYFISSLDFGGAQMGALRLLEGLADTYDITVVSLKPELALADDFPDEIDVETLGITSLSQAYNLAPLLSYVREADLLVNSLYHAALPGALLGRLTGTPTLTWQHRSSYRSKRHERVFRLAYRLSDGILADSPATARFLTTDIGVSDDWITTVTLAGIDTDRFRPNDDEVCERPRIVSVGRLVHEKGWDFLNRVARSLPFDFEVAGTGPLLKDLRKRAPDNVSYRGFVDDLPPFLNRGDVYFQPSRTEGLCITALEAMACGLPVVASNTDGLTDTVDDSVNGYVVPVGDISGYCNALQKALDRPDLGEAGRRRVVNQYNRDAMHDSFREVAQAHLR